MSTVAKQQSTTLICPVRRPPSDHTHKDGLDQTSTRGGTAPCRDSTISARAPLMSFRGTRLLPLTLSPTRARCLLSSFPLQGERCSRLKGKSPRCSSAICLARLLSRGAATLTDDDDDCYSCQCAGVRQYLHLHTCIPCSHGGPGAICSRRFTMSTHCSTT